MNKLNDLALQLKAAAAGLLSEVAAIDNEIQNFKNQRDIITSGKVSKLEYLDYLKAHFEEKASRFKAGLLNNIKERSNFDFGTLERGNSFFGVQFLASIHSPHPIDDGAIYLYFSDFLVEGVGRNLDDKDWPTDALPIAERREKLTEIESSIAELLKKRDEIVKNLHAAGLSY